MIGNTDRLENSIAKIKCEYAGGSKYGTGYLITSDLLLTSRHVIDNCIDDPQNINVSFKLLDIECKAETVVDDDSTIDVALIKLDTQISDIEYLELAYIPYNRINLYNSETTFNLIGFLSNKYKPSVFKCYTNSISDKTKWDLNISFAQNFDHTLSLDGISGSPFLLRDKILGLAIRQVDPRAGVPVGIVSIFHMKNFLDKNKVNYLVFDSPEMLSKDEIKNQLLDEVMQTIRDKYIFNDEIKRIIHTCSDIVIRKVRCLDVNEFSDFINTIRTTFNINYELDTQYRLYVKSLSEVIIHLSIILYACNGNLSLNYELGANIKTNDTSYIGYLFSQDYDSYITTIIRLMEHFIDDPLNKLNNCKILIIGSDRNDECTDKCNTCFSGSRYDFDSIIDRISCPRFLFEDKQDITDVKDKFNEIVFHCKKCVEYSTLSDNLQNVITRISSVLGGE